MATFERRRREVVAALAAFPFLERAAAEPRPKRLAIASTDFGEGIRARFDRVMKGLAVRGWAEGGRLQVFVYSGRKGVAVDSMAREVVAWGPDVIVTEGTEATASLRRATNSIPIVTSVADPVASGFASSLARMIE